MPVLPEVLDLAVRVEGDAARAAAMLEAAECVLTRAEARALARPPAEHPAARRRMAEARALLNWAGWLVQRGDFGRLVWGSPHRTGGKAR